MIRSLHLALATLALIPVAACDTGGDDKGLPPLEALFVPKPSDAASSTAVQAVCADGNDTIAGLEARIDAINGSVADDLALLQGLYETAPSTEVGVATYDVERDGQTLHVEVVTAAEQVAITGTLDGDEYLSGSYVVDGSQGALVIKGDDGDIASAWETEEGKLHIARDSADISVVVEIDAEKVSLAIVEGEVAEAAEWNRETRAGSFTSSEGTVGCWEAATAAADMCDATCGT